MDGLKIKAAGLPEFRSTDLSGITHLASLKELDLTDSPLDDEAIQYINALPNLVRLDVSNTNIDARSLLKLKRLLQLFELRMRRCSHTSEFLREFSKRSPRAIGVIMVNDCGLTDDDLKSFANITSLGTISLNGNKIVGSGLDFSDKVAISQPAESSRL